MSTDVRLPTGLDDLSALKQAISDHWAERDRLKSALAQSDDADQRRACWQALEQVDARLSELDSRFKRMWDAI